MRYMIVECHQSYAVALDEEGIFRKIANRQYDVGQFTNDVVEMKEPPALRKRIRRNLTSIVSLAACFVLVMASVIYMNMGPYASIYMTINPEVRIDVDDKDKVVKMKGLNEDGKNLIRGYEYKNKSSDKVMDDMVDKSIEMGFLKEGGKISLRLDGDGNWVTENGDLLFEHLQGHVKNKLSITIILEDQDGGLKVSVPVKQKKAQSTGGSSGGTYQSNSDYGNSGYSAPVSKPRSDYDNSDYSQSSNYDNSNYDQSSNYEKDDSEYND